MNRVKYFINTHDQELPTLPGKGLLADTDINQSPAFPSACQQVHNGLLIANLLQKSLLKNSGMSWPSGLYIFSQKPVVSQHSDAKCNSWSWSLWPVKCTINNTSSMRPGWTIWSLSTPKHCFRWLETNLDEISLWAGETLQFYIYRFCVDRKKACFRGRRRQSINLCMPISPATTIWNK